MTIKELAGLLYERYSKAVGGKAHNGDPIPDWETFYADPAKNKQADAWIAVAHEANRIFQLVNLDSVK